MTTNDAPPLSEEEIAELRNSFRLGAVASCREMQLSESVLHDELARFDRLVAEWDALRVDLSDETRIATELKGDFDEMFEANGVLLAENAALKAKVERLREQLRLLNIDAANLFAEATDAKAEVERLKADGERANEYAVRLAETLALYADPDFYFAVAFMFDRPCGGFADDFDRPDGDRYDRPGKAARAALSDLARKAQGGE